MRMICFVLLAFGYMQAAPNYKALMDEISLRLDKGLASYEQGKIEEAKELVTMAYFEIFENLEGPIRINVSSKKAYLMEAQFGEFRKMIVKGVPKEELKKAMDVLKKEMQEVLPDLESGVVVEGEATMEQEAKETQNSDTPKVWQDALAYIKNNFDKAVQVYEPDNSVNTRELIQDAQFEGYRNTMLETAIRQFVSSEKEMSLQSQFLEIIKFIHTRPTKEQLRLKLTSFINELNAICVGLGVPERIAQKQSQTKEQKPKIDTNKVKQELFAQLDKALSQYKEGNAKKATSIIQNAYFDIFEGSGLENAIGAKDANLKAEIESYFSKIIALIKKGSPADRIGEELQQMSLAYDRGAKLIGAEDQGFLALFIYSLGIILREGFEALLIVTAIIAYLIKSNNKDRLSIVYSSVTVAVILSFITAGVMNLIFGKASAQNREILEGATMLVASILLFYVSYWLLSNASAKKWTKYIKEHVADSLDSNSRKALWFTSFLAVYREGAETVLFYQALIADAVTSMDYVALASGFLVGVVGLLVMYFVMKFTAIKLPIKMFFMATGTLIYVMAFIFIGKGVMEFVEGKVLEPTLIDGMPTYIPLGIYPYIETIVPQLFVLLLGIIGIYFLLKNTKNKEDA